MIEAIEPGAALIEMAYRWADIEEALPEWGRGSGDGREAIGAELAAAVAMAFRVEAHEDGGETDFGDPWFSRFYAFFFDVELREGRDAATVVRRHSRFLATVINKLNGGFSHDVVVNVVSVGTPAEGQVCARPGQPPPKRRIDVADVPTHKPDGSSVPLTEKDGYWLTPIEVPFYDALRETGLVFAVQPWIQGVERRYRLDFLIFYDGGMVAVELDGHETHKTRDQRERDAKRDRWFAARRVRTLRWTGGEVTRNPQECVRQLLSILRGEHAAP